MVLIFIQERKKQLNYKPQDFFSFLNFNFEIELLYCNFTKHIFFLIDQLNDNFIIGQKMGICPEQLSRQTRTYIYFVEEMKVITGNE